MPDQTGTCTAAEADVLKVLRDGPAVLGHASKVVTHRRLAPGSYGHPPRAGAEQYGPAEVIRMVARGPARALERAGWITIDAGGTCAINPAGPAA